jgi:hypothetical protein
MSTSMVVAYVLAGLVICSTARAVHNTFIARRSRTWKLAVTVAGLGLGIGPALHNRPWAYLLVVAGGLASASLVAELAEQRAWAPPMRRQDRRPPPPLDSPPADRILTELDQAAAHRDLLRAHLAWLQRAARSGDIPAQRDAANEICTSADLLRDALTVVINERALLDRRR